MGPKQSLERWFQRVCVDQDRDAVDALSAPDAVFRGLEETVLSGPEEFKLYFRYVRNLGYASKPDYNYLRQMFRSLFLRNGTGSRLPLSLSLCLCTALPRALS